MANERNPPRRQEPDDDAPSDGWDDLMDDDFDFEADMDDDEDTAPQKNFPDRAPDPGRSAPAPRKRRRPEASAEDAPAPRTRRQSSEDADVDAEVTKQRRRRKVKTAPVEETPPEEEPQEPFRPEELEGAQLKDDGSIRVKEGAQPKKKDGKPKESWFKSLGVVDYIGLATTLAILIGLASMLLSWMYSEKWEDTRDLPDPVAEVPAAGELFKVTSIDSYWRRRTDDDRASRSEIIIPEITIQVEALAPDGHLSVFFRDPSGKMSADPGNLHAQGGAISVRATEGRQDSPDTFTFTSTKGFTFETEFRCYISMEQEKRWSIEIVETKDFGSSDSKRLAYFEISRDARTREDPDLAATE